MRVGFGDMAKAQNNPDGAFYDALADWVKTGNPPSRQATEELIVAGAVIAGAAPEVVAAIIAVAALIEGLEWVGNQLGIGTNFCDNPPIDEHDIRWIHFDDGSHFGTWPGGIPSGPWKDPPAGSFEAWALPVMKTNWEYAINCRAFLDYRVLLQALVDQWNKFYQPGSQWSASTAGYQLPDVMAAVQPYKWPTAPKIIRGNVPPLKPYEQAVAIFPPFTSIYTSDHELVINRGAVYPQLVFPGGIHIPGQNPPTSTGAKVATGVAAVGGVATIGVLVLAWVKGKTIGATLETLWKGAKKAAHVK